MMSPGLRPWAAACLLALAIVASASTAVAAESGDPVTEGLSVQDIDTSAYPKVSMTVSIPGRSNDAAEPTFTLSENGKAVTADTVQADVTAQDTKVVLMIDTSGSMSGATWTDVKRAAAAFLADLPESAPVSLIAFDETRRTLVDFSLDRALVVREIENLKPAHETALYDALLSASRALARQGDGRKAIVLFSDGGDTVSATTFGGAMQALKRTEIPLYSVLLHSAEENPGALRLLAGRSGGRLVPANRSDELPALFEGIAEEIVGAYTVEYTSLRPTTKDIEIDIEARATARSARARIAYPNPAYAKRSEPAPFIAPPVIEKIKVLAGIGGMILAAVTALVLAILGSIFRERSMLSHMHIYDQRERRGRWAGSIDYLSGIPARLVRSMEHFLTARGYTERLTPLFEAAGLPKEIAYYATTYVILALAAVISVHTWISLLPLTVIAFVVAALAPKYILRALAERRRHEIEGQMVEVLQLLSTSLRGGWTLERALELVAAEAPQPAANEFARLVAEIRLGMPAHVALEQMGLRLGSPDFDTLVAGISVQREVGGNLAEVVDAVTDTVRERDQLNRQMRTLTAEARFSAYILIALPFVIAFMMLTTSRSYFNMLFTSVTGVALLILTILMVVGGSIWVFRLTKIEV